MLIEEKFNQQEEIVNKIKQSILSKKLVQHKTSLKYTPFVDRLFNLRFNMKTQNNSPYHRIKNVISAANLKYDDEKRLKVRSLKSTQSHQELWANRFEKFRRDGGSVK